MSHIKLNNICKSYQGSGLAVSDFNLDIDGKEFIVFVLLSIVGLGVNELCMWLGTDLMGIHYMITKIGATAIVMVYNFVTRKMFIEKKN